MKKHKILNEGYPLILSNAIVKGSSLHEKFNFQKNIPKDVNTNVIFDQDTVGLKNLITPFYKPISKIKNE